MQLMYGEVLSEKMRSMITQRLREFPSFIFIKNIIKKKYEF
jgi:hypothetical protein